MICKIRKWLLSDAEDLTVAISNKKVQDNLRDGIPYPYTVQDGINFISAMLSADENDTYAFAITVDEKAIGSIGVYRQENINCRVRIFYCRRILGQRNYDRSHKTNLPTCFSKE